MQHLWTWKKNLAISLNEWEILQKLMFGWSWHVGKFMGLFALFLCLTHSLSLSAEATVTGSIYLGRAAAVSMTTLSPRREKALLILQQTSLFFHQIKVFWKYLKTRFTDRWIGLGGKMSWSDRSPYLAFWRFFIHMEFYQVRNVSQHKHRPAAFTRSYLRKSDVRLTVHHNSVWIRKTN